MLALAIRRLLASFFLAQQSLCILAGHPPSLSQLSPLDWSDTQSNWSSLRSAEESSSRRSLPHSTPPPSPPRRPSLSPLLEPQWTTHGVPTSFPPRKSWIPGRRVLASVQAGRAKMKTKTRPKMKVKWGKRLRQKPRMRRPPQAVKAPSPPPWPSPFAPPARTLPPPGAGADPGGNIRLLGFDPDGAYLQPLLLNRWSRHFTAFLNVSGKSPSWKYPASVDWREIDGGTRLPPVQDTGRCSGAWAFAAAAAVDSAWAITHSAPAPLTSRQQLIDCTNATANSSLRCTPGHPVDALEYASRLWNGSEGRTVKHLGLTDAILYPFNAQSASDKCREMENGTRGEVHGVVMYERVAGIVVGAFVGGMWKIFAAAVAHQPIIVALAAQPLKATYTGGSVYSDPKCFSVDTPLDHSVLLVGYKFPSNGSTPFWVIQNSWGTSWGDRGYGYIALKTDPGVCGIQSLPGVYPVIGGAPSCVGINPCGIGTCTVTEGGYTCTCPALFTTVINIDGSQTCAPTQVCMLLAADVCGRGTCVDGYGTYNCSCPTGFIPTETTDGSLTCGLLNPEVYTATYTTKTNDTCASVGRMYGLDVDGVLLFNFHLGECKGPIVPGTLLSIPLVDIDCTTCITAQTGQTCLILCRIIVFYPQASAEYCQSYFRTKGGLGDCEFLVSPDAPLVPGDNLCWHPGCIPGCNGYYKVKPGDTCTGVINRFYQRKPSLFADWNKGPCMDRRLFPGRPLCLPYRTAAS